MKQRSANQWHDSDAKRGKTGASKTAVLILLFLPLNFPPSLLKIFASVKDFRKRWLWFSSFRSLFQCLDRLDFTESHIVARKRKMKGVNWFLYFISETTRLCIQTTWIITRLSTCSLTINYKEDEHDTRRAWLQSRIVNILSPVWQRNRLLSFYFNLKIYIVDNIYYWLSCFRLTLSLYCSRRVDLRIASVIFHW